MRTKSLFVMALAGLVALGFTSAMAQEPKRSITKVKGDVYRFQNNFHYALVVPTGAGVVVVDPINADAASYLRVNLKQITNENITHLIYSHSHADHASGGTALRAKTVIAEVQEGGVARLVLALKQSRRLTRDAAEHLRFGIDDVPPARDVVLRRYKRCH